MGVLLLAGCAARQPGAKSWRLVGAGRTLTLNPPRPPGPDFTLTNARSSRKNAPACRLETRDVSFRWKGRNARVHALPDSLVATPGSLVAADNSKGPQGLSSETVLARNWFREDFLPNLASQQSAGCLAPIEIPGLAQRVIDNLAIPTATAYRLRYGEFAMNGYIDVDAKFRLTGVEPIRTNGQVTGYRTSFYLLKPAARGGVEVSAGASESNTAGTITAGTAVDSELLHLPADATYLRLFFRSWSIQSDRRIAVLAAGSQGALESATAEFNENPEAFCAGAAARGVSCVGVPKDTVIGPELLVQTNNRSLYVPVGGSLGDLLRAAGIRDPKTVLPTLKISKPYDGKLVPVDLNQAGDGILMFVFTGGEQVSW
ncbi:hypothetical protein [Paludibaculum fermentans]|uniref:Uncharacterized protein n=1 Tax=Paludibaculum fermentans TaxID=1473598 RepID=A0A7S7SJC2_PALFE|nr:hypothetical protein [Paludibaculum fermentans]QOY85840.1 hypothetical protein IRI77_23865 [Paludibaculum fermentans]